MKSTQVVVAATVLALAAACSPAPPSPHFASAMQVCQAYRPGTAFPPDPGPVPSSGVVAISSTSKRPSYPGVLLQTGDVLLFVADPSGRIDTSPGQVFDPQGRRDANGKDDHGDSAVAPDGWDMAGHTKFAVYGRINDTAQRFLVGSLSDCVQYTGTGGSSSLPALVYVGINIKEGEESHYTNRWDGSILVRLMIFHKTS